MECCKTKFSLAVILAGNLVEIELPLTIPVAELQQTHHLRLLTGSATVQLIFIRKKSRLQTKIAKKFRLQKTPKKRLFLIRFNPLQIQRKNSCLKAKYARILA